MAQDNKPISTSPPFQASLVKIERSKKHIAELATTIADHLAANPPPYFTFSKCTPRPPPSERGSRTLALEIAFHVPALPQEAAAILGDVIHNLRAALDLMASDLARLNGEKVTGVYFPFSETGGELDVMIKRKHFDRAGKRAVQLLKEFRPYRGGNAALRALHDLDVDDKHKFLIPMLHAAATPPVSVETIDGAMVLVPADGPHPPLLTTFPPGTFEGKEIIPTLHELVELTAGVVEAFKALTIS